jgi:hypothetical protein
MAMRITLKGMNSAVRSPRPTRAFNRMHQGDVELTLEVQVIIAHFFRTAIYTQSAHPNRIPAKFKKVFGNPHHFANGAFGGCIFT